MVATILKQKTRVAKTKRREEERRERKGKKEAKEEEKKEKKKRIIKAKKVVEEWEIWDDKDKATKFEEKTKKLVPQRFYK